jgi:prophage regulatory protein
MQGELNTPPRNHGIGEQRLLRRLLTRADLRSLGIRASNPTLLAWEDENKFPRRISISAAKVAWVADEIDAWIDAKMAARASNRLGV